MDSDQLVKKNQHNLLNKNKLLLPELHVMDECYVLSGSIEFEATSQTGDYYLPAHAIIGRESTPIRLDTC